MADSLNPSVYEINLQK